MSASRSWTAGWSRGDRTRGVRIVCRSSGTGRPPVSGDSRAYALAVDGERIPYEIVRSDRRTLALTVDRDGAVRVRSPRWLPVRDIERFVADRGQWLARKRAEVLARGWEPPTALTGEECTRAQALFADRLHECWEVFARPGEVMPKLRMRTMRSRWGSLSATGAMTLNTLLVRAPRECLDAVIYHELCHLRVRHHGPEFYRELARYVPEWRQRREDLRGRL